MDTEWEIGYFLMSHAVALDEEYRIGHVMMCLSTKVPSVEELVPRRSIAMTPISPSPERIAPSQGTQPVS